MKKAYHYDPISLLFVGVSDVHIVDGYEDYILPQCSLWTELPTYDNEAEQCKAIPKDQVWQVERKLVAVTAYNKQTCEPKAFNDKSLLTDDYTLDKPLTDWDEWINESWVSNESNKYIAEYNQIDDARRAAYLNRVTPLTDEAYIKRYIIKTPESMAEADELEQQALAARLKIQMENPWPTPPSN